MLHTTRPTTDQISRVSELLQRVPQDAARRRAGPLCVHGTWRGKDAWLVGYNWTRATSSQKQQQVREEVMGHAETLDGAIAMMEAKISAAR